MNEIDKIFKTMGRKALIGYITTGFPDMDTTLRAVPLLEKNGCDIIELGIPFSDPLADGPTIQRASFGALQNGVTLDSCFEVVRTLKKKTKIPLVFMTYYNPVYKYGTERFCRECSSSGVTGLIIPDLPPDEDLELEKTAAAEKLDIIFLLAPTSTDKRISLVAKKARGFIYLVSITGVTGARKALPSDLTAFVNKVRKATTKPLCVGFGISTPQQASRISKIADGIIMGSKLIELIEEDRTLQKLSEFVGNVRNAIDK
jgi:tryptophan synthase alpha chain